MVTSKSFMLATFASTMPNVYFGAFTTVLEQMIRVYDFTSQQASYLGALFQIGGILGGLLCSTLLTRASHPLMPGVLRKAPYKKVLLGISISTILSNNHVSL
jgi:hypothetical protein